jgi:DNA polymerase III delta prime subunit
MQLLSCHPIKSKLADWHENHLDKTLYLSGPSGIGKTEFMKAFLASLFGPDKVAFIRHFEDLKSVNFDNKDVFLFDDLALFKIFKKSPEELIHFLDRHNPSPIRVLYGICTIKDKVVVVTHNIPFDTGLAKLKFDPEQNNAIRRRVTSIETGDNLLPLAFPTTDNIDELKSNSDIYHPD